MEEQFWEIDLAHDCSFRFDGRESKEYLGIPFSTLESGCPRHYDVVLRHLDDGMVMRWFGALGIWRKTRPEFSRQLGGHLLLILDAKRDFFLLDINKLSIKVEVKSDFLFDHPLCQARYFVS